MPGFISLERKGVKEEEEFAVMDEIDRVERSWS